MSAIYQVETAAAKKFTQELFQGYGFTEAHATAIAENLVGAEMRGLRSHGLVRIELYLTQQKMGAIRTEANPIVVFETPTTAVLDACGAAGAVAGDIATTLAIEKAKQSGLGLVTIRNSNHFGGCGYYSEKIAQQEMIGIVASNTAPLMASPVTKKPVIGNNPFSVAVPAGKYAPINLDISNGVMAFGKIFEYRRQNKPFPENAWLDENGNPTTDPFANEFIKFISLPIAGHKGYGLALAVECLTSVLAGGVVAGDILPEPGHSQDECNPVTHTVMAIDLNAFGDKAAILRRSEELVEYLHSFETRDPSMKMLYPGELEGNAIAASQHNGINVPENVVLFMKERAEAVGVDFPSDVFRHIENSGKDV